MMKLKTICLAAVALVLAGALAATDIGPSRRTRNTPSGGNSPSGGNTSSSHRKAPSGKADVRDVSWGMSMQAVRKAETSAKLIGYAMGQLEFLDKILAQKVRLIYSFDNNRLVSLVILFSPVRGQESALHTGLKRALSDKYGNPSKHLVGRYGAAPYIQDDWAKPRTKIRLSSTAGQVRIEYTTTGLKQKIPVFVPGSDDRKKL